MTDSFGNSYNIGKLDNAPEEDILVDIDPCTLPIGDKKFHIFISYRTESPDRDIAHRIDSLLSKRGYKCCVHERDFEPGFIVENIQEKIKNSVKVVFLLSENFKPSEWCKYEMHTGETVQILNKGFRPIILKLDDCKKPDFLECYKHLSADTPIEKWINHLAKAINNQTDRLITSRKNIKFVAVPCIDYNRGKAHSITSCRYPHVCVKHIICEEECDGSCKKNHDLVTGQSREILVDLGFVTDGDQESLLKMYREKCKEKLKEMPYNIVTGPCCYYNHNGCLLGDCCPFTHICKMWFLGKCFDDNCKFSHDILNIHTKGLLEVFKIDVNQPEDKILDEYRTIYPHKTFLKVPAEKVSKIKFLQENCLFVFCGILAIVSATLLVVYSFQK